MSGRCLAIIPARGGSEGIPKKNITPLAGKPLLAWTVESAMRSDCLDRIVVSTDDPEIAEVALRLGVEIPYIRPKELAQDDTPGILPILHAAEWLEMNEDYRADFILCLQPTSPLRTAEDIDAAMHLVLQKNADAIVSVTPVECHPYWMKRIDKTGHMHDLISLETPITRRQDLPAVYSLNGAVYLARWSILLELRTWYTGNTIAFVMPRERSLEIDSSWDLYLAELILKNREKHESDQNC